MKPQDLFTPRGTLNTSIADRIEYGDCWEWTGATSKAGYGNIQINKTTYRIHRLIYQTLVGPTPKQLDHLCQNKKCCNPDHLQPVTPKQNSQRANTRTHCKHGHRRTPQNTYNRTDGKGRNCKICGKHNQRRYRKTK